MEIPKFPARRPRQKRRLQDTRVNIPIPPELITNPPICIKTNSGSKRKKYNYLVFIIYRKEDTMNLQENVVIFYILSIKQ